MPNSQVHGAAAVVHPTALPAQMLHPPERNYSCVPSARPKVVCTQLVLKLAGSIADFTIDNSSALLGAICRYANVDMANVRQVFLLALPCSTRQIALAFSFENFRLAPAPIVGDSSDIKITPGSVLYTVVFSPQVGCRSGRSALVLLIHCGNLGFAAGGWVPFIRSSPSICTS
jgi:hypothetical protein